MNEEMKTSEAGLDLIKSFEKLRLVAFKPVQGDPWTLAWGRTRGVQEGDTCSEEEADEWLQEDVGHAEAVVRSCVSVELTQGQFDALVSFAYNVGNGAPGVKDGLCHLKSGGQSHLLIYTNEGRFENAAAEFIKWDKSHGIELEGLRARRLAEKELFLC